MTRRKVSVHTHRPGPPSATGSPGPSPTLSAGTRRQVRGLSSPRAAPRSAPTSTRRCRGREPLGESTGRAVGPEGTGWEPLRAPGSRALVTQRPRQEAGHSPSSRRRPCACRSRPGSRRGRAWGTRSRRRPPAARSGGRPGSRGAESLRRGAVRVAGHRQGPRRPLSPGPLPCLSPWCPLGSRTPPWGQTLARPLPGWVWVSEQPLSLAFLIWKMGTTGPWWG